MGTLNRAVAVLWRGAQALRRTSPPLETSRERIVWMGGRIAGVYITPEEALRLSTVWACVTVISKSLASCRWDVFREMPNGDREPRRQLMTYRLLNERPNPEMTAFAFREAALIQALVWGNFIAEIELDMAGRPAGLWPIAPDRWCLERDPSSGRLVCRVSNHDRPDTLLDYDDVFHLHGPGIDGLTGFDVVNVAARSFAHAAAAQRFGQAFYGNGTQMGGVLTSTAALNEAQVEELKKRINERHQGPEKAFNFLLLGGGLDYKALTVPPNDAQFIETQQHLVEEVCRWFGVPPHKVQHLLRSTNNNIEHQGIEFVRDALVPWAERLAQEADWKLLPDWVGIKTRLDLDWLAEGDAKSKAETDSILVNAGIRTRQEVRKTRGWNTVKDKNADKLTVQMNMTILEKIGMEQPEPAADEEPDEEPGAERAARALFASTMKRCMKRQFHRAEDAARNATSAEEFDRRLASRQADHVRYAGEQVEQALSALGVRIETDAIKSVLVPALGQEPKMLSDAYRAGDLSAWCDIDARSDEIAAALTALIAR